MAKFIFDCKGKLENDKPCDKHVSTKLHKGISTAIKIQRLNKKKEMFELNNRDITEIQNKQNLLNRIPEVPTDWEFTLICSRGHEEDYTYDERKK